jgi:hypothetical protein
MDDEFWYGKKVGTMTAHEFSRWIDEGRPALEPPTAPAPAGAPSAPEAPPAMDPFLHEVLAFALSEVRAEIRAETKAELDRLRSELATLRESIAGRVTILPPQKGQSDAAA